MPQRVLHLVSSLDYRGNISQLLAACRGWHGSPLGDSWRFEIATLTNNNPRSGSFDQLDIPRTELHRRFNFDPIAWMRLRRLLRKGQFDVVHTWDSEAAVALSRATWGKPPLRHIATFRGGDNIGNAITANSTICWSDFERQLLVDAGRSAEWCKLIRPAVESTPSDSGDQPTDFRAALLSERKVPTDAHWLGVIGRLVPSNNVEWLIWVFDLVLTMNPNAYLLVIGDGPLKSNLFRYADRASSLDHVIFLGEREDAPTILSQLDVLLNAADHNRLSMSILEALAVAVNVVVPDLPVHRHYVELPHVYLEPAGDRAAWGKRIISLLEAAAEGKHESAVGKAASFTTPTEFATTLTDIYRREP